VSSAGKFWHEKHFPEIEKSAGKRENRSRVKKIIHRRRNLSIGVLLAFFSVGILTTIGIFLWQKYSGPVALARILPADKTLFFAEIRTNAEDENWRELAANFENISPTALASFDKLSFAAPDEFLNLLDERIGFAFLGAELDPDRFVLILNVADPDAAFDFLTKQTLVGEKLLSRNYFHQKIYFYPRSHPLAFFFFGDDLIVASERTDLEKIARVIHDKNLALRSSPNYSKVIAKIDPRATAFAFFSEKFLEEILTASLDGLRSALAAPLVEIWASGGATIEPRADGLVVESFFAVKNNFARAKIFARAKNFDLSKLAVFGDETRTFFAGRDLAKQLRAFFADDENEIAATILRGAVGKFSREWLGAEIDAGKFLPEFLGAESIVGFAENGIVGRFPESENFAEFVELVADSAGRIAVERRGEILEDGTVALEMSAEDVESSRSEIFFASQKIEQIAFPNFEIDFAKIGGEIFFATNIDDLKKILARVVAEENSGFAELARSVAAPNIFFARLVASENPLLAPFQFFASGVRFEPDGARMKFLFGQ